MERSALWFPKLISDGMVLSQSAGCRIYGKSAPGDEIRMSIQDRVFTTFADDKGDFSFRPGKLETGGPFEMLFHSNSFGESVIGDVYIGEAYIGSGQSNMELPMRRVRPAFPSEWTKAGNPMIRMFKVNECYDFHGPKEDHLQGSWVTVSPETFEEVSALGYFFSCAMNEKLNVPIGFIQTAIGGTPIQAWLPKDLLLQEDLEILAPYEEDAYIISQIEKNNKQEREWYDALESQEIPVQELDWTESETMTIPGYFGEENTYGSYWFKREFTVSQKHTSDAWTLYLGTIVDADDAYINGVHVGKTEYKYPPRWYHVPSGIIHEGVNEIVVRIIVNQSAGRWTPGKEFFIECENEHIDLSGEWMYQMRAKMPLVPPRDFIQYRPTGLHNAMLAPCFGYGISGFLWYQGESNTRFPESYEMYMRTLVRYVREKFDSRELPFGIVQLANFDVDLVPVGSGWPEVREAQRRAAIAMNCGLAVILDVGESNDLHPLDKKSIGERLADYMLRVRENKNNAGLGPELDSINWNETGTQCRISFKTCNGGLATKKVEALNVIQKRPDVEDLQSPIEDAVDSFVLSLQDGRKLRVQGQITDDTSVNLTLPQSISRNDIASIQYAYENNPIGNLLCNSQGYLASPFLLPIAK